MKKRLISEEMVISSWVMGSDDEIPFVYDLYVGIDVGGCLIVSVERTDFEDPDCNCSTWARLSNAESLRLARRLKTRLTALPNVIDRFVSGSDDWSDTPDKSEIIACFKDITERLLDEGCHFKILRNTGRNGLICC